MNDRAIDGVLGHLATLADGLRVRMLLVLEGHELSVSEICEVLQLPQSTVSRHLKTLAEDGWVTSRREGTSRLYSMSAEELSDASRGLWAVVRAQAAATEAAAQDARRLRAVVEARRARSQAFFATAAGQWDRLRDEFFGQSFHLQALLGLLDERWVVADLGCGTGRGAEALAPFVARVVAVDASEEMLSAARERLAPYTNVDLRRGRLEALPLADGSVDAAQLALVLHVLPDPGVALAEVARVLHPGGRLLIVDMLPHDDEGFRQQMGQVWLGFSEGQIARLLSAAGFAGTRVVALPAEPRARGPGLFVATARRAAPAVSPRRGDDAGFRRGDDDAGALGHAPLDAGTLPARLIAPAQARSRKRQGETAWLP